MRTALLVTVLSCVGSLAACPPPPTVVVREATPPPRVDLSLGPDDVFEVRVYGEPELTGTFRVAANGTIDFPLIGRVVVRGLTTVQVADEITDKLHAYLKRPQVTVFLKEVHSKKIVLIGQVRTPGTINFVEGMTLEQAVSQAGGLTPMAAKDRVRVTRVSADKAETLTVNFKAIAEGSQTFYLQPGDTISVDERLF